VIVLTCAAEEAEEVRRRLQRSARTAIRTRLAAVVAGELVAVASPDGERWLREAAEGVPAGLSGEHPLTQVAAAVQEARTALAEARRQGADAVVRYADTSGGRLLSALAATDLPEAARSRVDRIRSTPEGEESLRLAALWFEHGCRWESAAEAAGMHRHSLRTRVERLASTLELDLDSFPARAELWALLSLS
jgi:PucR family transcriptional regulator, purine catabolism regulatory protein